MSFRSALKTKTTAGFTLIELLVVIAIIAVLSTIGLSSFTSAQARARDARRYGDIKAMQDSFEQYYNTNNVYLNDCNTSTSLMYSSVQSGKMPVDPKNVAPNTYVCASTATTYCACAGLEVLGKGNSTNSSCNFVAPGAAAQGYYCVRQLQ